MKRNKADLLAAIASDEAALQTAQNILQDTLSGYAKVPYALNQAREYLKSVSADLYEQLALALNESGQWKDLVLERMLDEDQPNLCAAAPTHLVCLTYRRSDAALNRAIRHMTTRRTAAPDDLYAVIRCFADTPTACAFLPGTSPCLSAQQVRRLGMLLGAEFYGEWIRRCAQDAQGRFAIECADLYTMVVWGFGWAEMLCTTAGEGSSAYAQAVSSVTLANLAVDFDDWRVLRHSLDSMMAQREVFRATLETLCAQMELEAVETGHLTIPEPSDAVFDTVAWTAALERGVYTGHSMNEEEAEETIDTDDETE